MDYHSSWYITFENIDKCTWKNSTPSLYKNSLKWGMEENFPNMINSQVKLLYSKMLNLFPWSEQNKDAHSRHGYTMLYLKF
jgi:hypothetical protein